MNIKVIFLFCGLLVYSQRGESARLSGVGGKNATDGEFPYMVQIRNEDNCFSCGGSIIAPRWILTAGHCIKFGSSNDSSNYTVVYGTTRLYDCFDQNKQPDTAIKVKALYKHPNWSGVLSGVPSNDVGIIELQEDIPFNTYAQPITLASEGIDPPVEEIGNLTGWGSVITGGAPFGKLQKISLSVLANEECSTRIDNIRYGITFNGTQFLCTDDQERGQCNGDSGSPYVINGIQYGIVSWSLKPCGLYPGVYSRVGWAEHRQWIENVTGI